MFTIHNLMDRDKDENWNSFTEKSDLDRKMSSHNQKVFTMMIEDEKTVYVQNSQYVYHVEASKAFLLAYNNWTRYRDVVKKLILAISDWLVDEKFSCEVNTIHNVQFIAPFTVISPILGELLKSENHGNIDDFYSFVNERWLGVLKSSPHRNRYEEIINHLLEFGAE